MIISRTPLRVSFVGGGTDLRAYYSHRPGAVVSMAIDKYVYITVNDLSPLFGAKIILKYARTERVNTLDEVEHTIIKAALRRLNIKSVEITSMADIPAGTGMGSSSSFAVGLLNALYAYKGQYRSGEELAREACEIEIKTLREPIGKQDQYIAAYGGLQYIQFNPDETVFVDPILCNERVKKQMMDHLLLLYTGVRGPASDVLTQQRQNIQQDEEKRRYLTNMVHLTRELREELSRNRIGSFGEILHQNWLLKQRLADGVTSPQIDAWYEAARQHGAEGGKILGAGGGGFLLFWAPKERHKEICAALPELQPARIDLEPQGSKIIYIGG